MIGNVIVGVVSRQGPDKNPLMKRLLKSMNEKDPGISIHVQVELGEQFTRGEKRQRIFNLAKRRMVDYVIILEDDTEIVVNNWAVHLVTTASNGNDIGMVNPAETRDGLRATNPAIQGKIIEAPNLFGFCILYSMDWNPVYDPKITWLDDMAMSLQCRSRGKRLAVCGGTMIRHTKEPFVRDDQPPWMQKDRSRWGEGNAYYDKERFDTERKSEAKLLIDQYGEMARMTLPPELL
jgi:hypothetical protein